MRAAALVLALVLSACGGGAALGDEDDGRETVLIRPADGDTRYLVYPAILDDVFVRPSQAAAGAGTEVGVEVLLKGTLPDACSELDAARQSRAGNFVTVDLTMRTPRGAVCAQVTRPFRFYIVLEGGFEPGHYTLTLNGTAHPFRIREATPDPDGEGPFAR